MLQFNDFLIILRDYRKAICFECETATIDIVAITDEKLSIDVTVIHSSSAGVKIRTPITLSVDNDGEVIAEINHGSYLAKTLSLLEYVTLVMYNRVNAMLRTIEEAKSEVLDNV